MSVQPVTPRDGGGPPSEPTPEVLERLRRLLAERATSADDEVPAES